MSRKLPPLLNGNSEFHWSRTHSDLSGGEIFFLFETDLTMSHVTPSPSLILNSEEMNAIFIPVMTVREQLLVNRLRRGLPVVAVDLMGHQYEVVIKWWPSINEYVLIGNWPLFVENNGLDDGDSVCLYFFRRGGDDELRLIIEPV